MDRWVPAEQTAEAAEPPVREPMRPKKQTKTPSTERKRQLRRRGALQSTASEFTTDAWRLVPGDSVRGPNGQLMKIKRVAPHKTDSSKCVLTLDGGGAIIEGRDAKFTIVRGNQRQMELPDSLGTPGGNFNYLPGGSAVEGMDPGNLMADRTCPNCHGQMQLHQGGLVCPKCGYTSFPGQAGRVGESFTMDPNNQPNVRPSGGGHKLVNSALEVQPDAADRAREAELRRHAAKYAPPTGSAIARRAQQVLDMPEGALL